MVDATDHMQAADVWTFADFTLRQTLPSVSVEITSERLENWQLVFGEIPQGRDLPRGLVVSALVEGFIRSAQPRPQGNIHARQRLVFSDCPLRVGDVVDVSAKVLTKEVRRDRNWITFRLIGRVCGVRLCSGDFTVIWAS